MDNKKAEEIKKKAEADAGKMLKEAELKGRQILDEARKKADAETGKALKDAEQKGRQIIEEARKKADTESANTIKEIEQKGRQIIEEAKKKADAEANKTLKDAEQKGRLIIEEARKKGSAQPKAAKPADLDQKGSQLIEEARKKAEADAGKIIAEAQQKARQITEEAKKKPGVEAKPDRVIVDAEQRARQIIEEAERIAAASSPQRPALIMKAVREKAGPDTGAKQPQAAAPGKAELMIIPPVDFSQLQKLRLALQQMPNLRIMSTGGSLDGGTQISIMMEKPIPLADAVRSIAAVEEAIEEEALDSHPLGDFIKKAVPARSSKRRDEQRILIVLKRPQ
jgi:vacuolar-type H+-ATPase subunit H